MSKLNAGYVVAVLAFLAAVMSWIGGYGIALIVFFVASGLGAIWFGWHISEAIKGLDRKIAKAEQEGKNE